MESLIYWRDVKKSGVVFGAGLATLLSMTCFPVISVVACSLLLLLAGTIGFRIYKTAVQIVQKTSGEQPFKEYLDLDLTVSREEAEKVVGIAVGQLNYFTDEVRRLFLVEDLVESIKLFILLWVISYVGSWFNGMTWIILAYISLFALPKLYEDNKQYIDTYLDVVRSKWTEMNDKIKVAIPTGSTGQTEKDK